MINMRKLNSVEIGMDKGSAVVGGGAIVQEVVNAAKLVKAHISKC